MSLEELRYRVEELWGMPSKPWSEPIERRASSYGENRRQIPANAEPT